MTDYQVARPLGMCSASGRALEEGETFYAVLFESDKGLERCDFSEGAWSGPPNGFFCFWKSTVPLRKQKKRLLVDDDVILNLFIRLEDSEPGIKEDFRFVLALILMRKRILKYTTTSSQGGREIWTMRQAKEQTEHRVCNPRLSDDRIDQVSQELGAILNGEVATFDDLDAATGGSTATDSGDEHVSDQAAGTENEVAS